MENTFATSNHKGEKTMREQKQFLVFVKAEGYLSDVRVWASSKEDAAKKAMARNWVKAVTSVISMP